MKGVRVDGPQTNSEIHPNRCPERNSRVRVVQEEGTNHEPQRRFVDSHRAVPKRKEPLVRAARGGPCFRASLPRKRT